MDKHKHCHHHHHDDDHNCKCKKQLHDQPCECQCECEEHEEKEPDLGYQTNLEEKVLEYVQTAQRLQAEFDNYRKKAQEEVKQSRFYGMADAAEKFLPVLDGISAAKKMVEDEKMLEGFVMIENLILGAFTALGIEKIEAVGQAFDPSLHNALAVQNNPEMEDDIVLDEYQAGYKLNDKIIRYSQVIVNKKEE